MEARKRPHARKNAQPLAVELETLIDGVNEINVDSLQARIKEEIHWLLRVP